MIGLVVQPGVEFGSDYIIDYDRTKARQLSAFIESNPQLIFEAHSTDYQRCQALTELVADHFAILKVGPGLTFAFREAVLALAAIEQEWLAHRSEINLSGILDALEQVMKDDPRYWVKYYRGDENDLTICVSIASATASATTGLTERSSKPWPGCCITSMNFRRPCP